MSLLRVFPRDCKVSAVVSRHKMHFDQLVKELNSSSAIKGFGDQKENIHKYKLIRYKDPYVSSDCKKREKIYTRNWLNEESKSGLCLYKIHLYEEFPSF